MFLDVFLELLAKLRFGIFAKIILALAVVAFLINIFLTYGIVIVSFTYKDNIKPQTVTYSSIQENKSDKKLFAIGNVVIIERSTKILRVQADDVATIKQFTLPFYGLVALPITIQKDYNADKYSGYGLGCNTYDPAKDILLSYNCNQSSNLVHYDRSKQNSTPWENRVVSELSTPQAPLYTVASFKGGVIGLSGPNPSSESHTVITPLFTINSIGNRQQWSIPPELSGNVSIVTENSANLESNFLLVSDRGDIHFGTMKDATGTSIHYRDYNLPDSYSELYDTLACRLIDVTAYCYYGPSSSSTNTAGSQEWRKNHPNGTIVKIDFSNPESDPIVTNFTTDIPIDTLSVSTTGFIMALQGNNLHELTLANSTAKKQFISSNVTSVASYNNSYYIRDNSLYKINYQTKESSVVFHSSNLTLKKVNVFDDAVLFDTTIAKSVTQRIHTFKLSSVLHDSQQKRLLDSIPYDNGLKMNDFDYWDDTIRIRVFSTATPDRSKNITTYNDSEYLANQADILQSLTDHGIDTHAVQVLMSH